jgi:hypothetical protein
MTSRPEWLADFQRAFGAALRTPLESSSGTFRAILPSYPATAVVESVGRGALTAAERIAVYNRQYWFRLFGVFQNTFPLTTRLLGHFTFNECASAFLSRNPPRGWNIDDAPAGFDAFMSEHVPDAGVAFPRHAGVVDRQTVLEAARIDAAWHRVFFAEERPPFRPAPDDAPRLFQSRLVPAEAVQVIEEHRPLVELRRKLSAIPGEAPVPAPPPLEEPAYWAFVRKPAGIGQLPLAKTEARLLTLLRVHPVAEALALLESECAESERASLPARIQTWLARSVELDFWSGIEPA